VRGISRQQSWLPSGGTSHHRNMEATRQRKTTGVHPPVSLDEGSSWLVSVSRVGAHPISGTTDRGSEREKSFRRVGDSEWGHTPQRRVSAPVGLPRKGPRHVCIDTSKWGHISSRSVHTILRVGAHPSSGGIIFPPPSEKNPIKGGAYGWTDVGYPIEGFSWSSPSGGTSHHRGIFLAISE